MFTPSLQTTLDLHAGVLTQEKTVPMPYLCNNTVTNTGSYLMLGRTLSARQSQALPVRSPGLSSTLLLHYCSVCLKGTERELDAFCNPSSSALTSLLPSLPLPLALAACSPCNSGIKQNHRPLKCVSPTPGRQCYHDTALNIFKVIWREGTEQFTT